MKNDPLFDDLCRSIENLENAMRINYRGVRAEVQTPHGTLRWGKHDAWGLWLVRPDGEETAVARLSIGDRLDVCAHVPELLRRLPERQHEQAERVRAIIKSLDSMTDHLIERDE